MKICHGFSTLEFLIYFSIMTFFSCLVTHAWWRFHHLIGIHADESNRVNLYCAHDLLVRDLMQASPDRMTWYVQDQHFIWRTSACDVGWELSEQKLFRSQGSFNFYTATWSKRTRCLIADTIEHLQLTMHYKDENVRIIESSCVKAMTHDSRITYLKNRIL